MWAVATPPTQACTPRILLPPRRAPPGYSSLPGVAQATLRAAAAHLTRAVRQGGTARAAAARAAQHRAARELEPHARNRTRQPHAPRLQTPSDVSDASQVAHECSAEGEGSLSGNLTTQQIVVSLWLFVRHLPTMQAQAPFSPLTPLLPPLIERLLLLITDLVSLPSHHLCDVLHVLARLQRAGKPAGLLNRLLAQVAHLQPPRLTRNPTSHAQPHVSPATPTTHLQLHVSLAAPCSVPTPQPHVSRSSSGSPPASCARRRCSKRRGHSTRSTRVASTRSHPSSWPRRRAACAPKARSGSARRSTSSRHCRCAGRCRSSSLWRRRCAPCRRRSSPTSLSSSTTRWRACGALPVTPAAQAAAPRLQAAIPHLRAATPRLQV